MRELAAMFDPPAEVIADFRVADERHGPAAGRDEIMNLLRRRPSSLDDIAGGLGIHRNEAAKHIEHLLAEGLIEPAPAAGKLYYKAADKG
jgi:predicted ArsR family transcriptional regulator